jgi:hypothetical protein
MVHDRKSAQFEEKDNDFRNEIDNSSNAKIVMPEWSIDDEGIPYCTQQSEYEDIIKTNLKKRFPFEFEKRLNCQHCTHYHQNNCYFPKSEIDKIEADRTSLKIRCELCGTKIDRPFSILMSLFYKEKFGVTMPIICCSCFSSLENGTFLKNSKRRSLIFIISLGISLYFLFNFFSAFAFNWVGILVVIVPFFFWGTLSFRDIRNIYLLYKGRKYYRHIMDAEAIEQIYSRRDDMLDDDDKQKPSKGAYDSPGYEY